MINDETIVTCTRCRHKHKRGERAVKYSKKRKVHYSACPRCGGAVERLPEGKGQSFVP